MKRDELYRELKLLIDDPSMDGETLTLSGVVLAMDADWLDVRSVLGQLVKEGLLVEGQRKTYRIVVDTGPVTAVNYSN